MKKALICMLQLHKNSGSARTAFENIHYFKSKGLEVHVAAMTMDDDAIRAEGAVPHKMIPWLKSTGIIRRRWYNWQVQNLRKKLKPDITVGHGDIQDQDVVTLHNCVFLASELIHGGPLSSDHEMAKTHGPLLRNQGFKKLIANSNLMKEDLIHRFNIPTDKIEVIYPALDTKNFFPRPESKAELRQRFKFDDKVVVAFVTSGNFKKRGLDLFSQAIDALPEEIKSMASFRVVGKEAAEASKLITFDPSLEDIENYFRAIDIMVLPARIEEFGRVIIEAMGCGLPVITTDKVGAAELLTGKSRRFVIPSNNPEQLSSAIDELIRDKQLREELGKLNAETVISNSELNVFKQFDLVFDSLI